MVGRSLHINNFKEACLVLPRPFPGLFSAKFRHEFCSGVFTLAGCCNRDSKGMIAGTRAKNLGRGLTEVEGNEDLMAAQGHSHRYARDGLWFRKGVCPTRSSPDAPLILLALSIRIETAVVPRPGSMRPHWTMPPHPRYVHLLACPIRPSIQHHPARGLLNPVAMRARPRASCSRSRGRWCGACGIRAYYAMPCG